MRGSRIVTGFVFASLAVALASTGASASLVYTDQANFAAVLSPGYYFENYQSAPSGGHATPWNFAGGAGNAYTYSATTNAIAFLAFDLAGNRYLTTSGQPTTAWSAPITINFTGAPVYALGGSFFFTSAGGAVVNGTVGVALSDGTNVGLTGQSNSTFWGYVSDTPITSIVISPDATHHFVSVDNLYVGTSNVPEPASAVMMIVAGAVGVIRSRRRGR